MTTIENFLYSPFPAAVLGNLFYPYRHIKTNIMLGKELEPKAIIGPYIKVPSFWENLCFVGNSQKIYTLWDGFTPTVLADVAYLSTYSMSSMYLFKRKRQKGEFFRAVETNRLAFEECVLSVLCNTVTLPLRAVSLRSMAQLTGAKCFDYRRDIFQSLLHIVKSEGVKGLFQGLVPLLISDLCRIFVTRCVFELVLQFAHKYRKIRNKYSRRSREETRSLNKFENVFSLLMRCFFHPLSLVTLMMTLNNSDVTPFVQYSSTLECVRDLYSTSSFYRGFLNWLPWYIPIDL